MVGVGVEPPARPSPAGVAARLAVRGVRLRRVTAKRSWPPGCGRLPAPVPAGSEEKGADDGSFDAIPPMAENRALPAQGLDKVDVAAAPAAGISRVVQNGALPRQGQNKAAAAAADSPMEHNSVLQPQQGPEQVVEEGHRGDNGQVGSLILIDGMDDQKGNRTAQVVAQVVAVLENNIVGSSTSLPNGGEGTGLLVEGCGISGDVAARDEASGDSYDRENANMPGGVEFERKMDGLGKGIKRRLSSAMNLPTKRRLVSAVRKFPPGCGRLSAVRRFPPGCGRAAVTTIGNGDDERMQLGATTTSNSDASALEALAGDPDLGGTADMKLEGKEVVEKGSTSEHNKSQESPFACGSSPVDYVEKKENNDQLPSVLTKASPKNVFTQNMNGNISPHEGKQVSQVVRDDKVRNKLVGILQKDISTAFTKHLNDQDTEGKRFDGDKMNAMRQKNLSTTNEPTPSKAIMKKDKFAHKPYGDDIGKNTLERSRQHIISNQIPENDEGKKIVGNQIIVQALMAPDKCPWKQGRKPIASASKSLASRKKLKGKDFPQKKLVSCELASGKLANDETIDDNEDCYHKDHGNSRALVVCDEKREQKEFSINLPPCVPSASHHRQFGDSDLDARTKVRMLLQNFQGVCRKLIQAEEQHLCNIGRIDYEASNIIKKHPMYTKPEPIVGTVPGIEVGDEFHFRVELALVGLHCPLQGGISTTRVNGVLIATSILASGGYSDELSSSDELIYTGSRGKASGKKEVGDQKLKYGNLALKNSIDTKTPVRVIHGFKGQSTSEVAHCKGKQISTFTYDGLYNVVEYWQEGLEGSMVFKYKLQRIPGQPQLALHVVKAVKKLNVREGLLLPDLSHASERIPICIINVTDSLMPTPFKYITRIIYPPWYEKEPPTGCDCTSGCSDSVRCACAVKNGGEIPYNFNGAIVEAKPLIYECGPSCRCPPTCHNRVSQHGVKIPLEIFKTNNTGWGVRSLSSISSGSFICEYSGELLQDKEAEKRENDEYLFDIGQNYQDEELWKGLKSTPGLESSTSSSKTMEGFTIDAAECGNVGRFINHSCSPNLYAQHVLWDHDDVEKPHVMFFAVENIPPLQELTYHYNYTIGQVKDKNGKNKGCKNSEGFG